MKKIVGFLLAILLMLSAVGCGAGKLRETVNDNNPVAVLTIHTFDGSYGSLPLVANFGHTFISVQNISNKNLTIGVFTLAPQEEVAVGTWGASAHWGVWYNLEAYYYEAGKYDTCVTLSKNIDAAAVNTLTEYILANDKWKFFYNCSVFSIGAWNSVSDADAFKVSGLANPNKVKKKLEQFENVKGAKPITSYTLIGFETGEGFRTYVPEALNND